MWQTCVSAFSERHQLDILNLSVVLTMRIRRPRDISTLDLVVVTVLGVVGGVYIWRPIFDKRSAEQPKEAEALPKSTDSAATANTTA
ncbi:uncharacterized protein LOC143920323 [Arctopsyche grandis]|uniref:uncharacterized protein LOC143920323 n=1 Tax=Arctopsyche grandis TaxID=121162 RepID=UPI00406D78E6